MPFPDDRRVYDGPRALCATQRYLLAAWRGRTRTHRRRHCLLPVLFESLNRDHGRQLRFATRRRRCRTSRQRDSGEEAGGDAIKSVLDKTKDDRSKNRGTFHCLLAEASGTLGKLS
jgi:hypothetical protein